MNTQTLLKQLGTALPMMGAKDFVDLGYGMSFKIQGSKRGNKIVITLATDSDTYIVDLWRGITRVGSVEGVHVEQLHSTLESLTGLYTRL